MVGTEVLVVGIVVPLIVGPVSIFFKSLWDKYNNSQEEKRKNYYESRLNELKNKIDLFYWPVYIKLKCLYSLNYNDSKIKDTLQSDNESDRDEKINNFIKRKFIPKKKKIRKKKKSLLTENNYFTDNSMDWDDDLISNKKNTDIELLDDSEISSDENKIQKDRIPIKVDEVFINQLDQKIISLSLEIKNIIEKNISILKPNKELINEIVRFVRFTEMIIIVENSNKEINIKDIKNINNINLDNNNTSNSNIKLKYNKCYKYDSMGVVNNTKQFYKLIKDELDCNMLEYQNLFKEYNNLQNFKNCSKIFNCNRKTSI